jgi:hypothetical protein
MLLAMLWFSMSLGAFAVSQWWKAPDQSPPLLVMIVAAIVLGPFVAIGTLFGHPFRGLMIGLLLAGAYAIAATIAISSGWVGFP